MPYSILEMHGLKFDIVVFGLRIRDVELKKEKKELGKRDKNDSSSSDALFAQEDQPRKSMDIRKMEDHDRKVDHNPRK